MGSINHIRWPQSGHSLEQLFNLLLPDFQKVVGTLGRCRIKQQLSNVFHMPLAGAVASRFHGMQIAQPVGPPGLPIHDALRIAIDEMPHQQLQGSGSQVLELQFKIDQLQVQMAQFQHT